MGARPRGRQRVMTSVMADQALPMPSSPPPGGLAREFCRRAPVGARALTEDAAETLSSGAFDGRTVKRSDDVLGAAPAADQFRRRGLSPHGRAAATRIGPASDYSRSSA